jgi:transglutaminase/protease-like cytokinesis protein 3
MLRIFGIKAEGISGYSKSSGESHIWTEADLDGTRYYIDSTWNDELKSMKYFTTDINLLRQERDWDETYYARYRGLVQ